MITPDDWRLGRQQEDYLTGATLRWQSYVPPAPHWDHDHCEFCWQRFSALDSGYADAIHEGYATAGNPADHLPEGFKHHRDDYYWICPACYEDFKGQFQWKVIEGPEIT